MMTTIVYLFLILNTFSMELNLIKNPCENDTCPHLACAQNYDEFGLEERLKLECGFVLCEKICFVKNIVLRELEPQDLNCWIKCFCETVVLVKCPKCQRISKMTLNTLRTSMCSLATILFTMVSNTWFSFLTNKNFIVTLPIGIVNGFFFEYNVFQFRELNNVQEISQYKKTMLKQVIGIFMHIFFNVFYAVFFNKDNDFGEVVALGNEKSDSEFGPAILGTIIGFVFMLLFRYKLPLCIRYTKEKCIPYLKSKLPCY